MKNTQRNIKKKVNIKKEELYSSRLKYKRKAKHKKYQVENKSELNYTKVREDKICKGKSSCS